MSLLAGRRIQVIDLETTGFRPRFGAWIVEIARVTVEDGTIAGQWSTLLRGPRPIPPEATEIHGITDDMLRDAPAGRDVAAGLRASCGDDTLAFHNACFDLPFLAALMRESGTRLLDAPVVDTLGMARGFQGDEESGALGEVGARLGVPDEVRHRALGDARTTAHCLIALAPRWERERGITTLLELAVASQEELRRVRARRAEKRAAEAAAASAQVSLPLS